MRWVAGLLALAFVGAAAGSRAAEDTVTRLVLEPGRFAAVTPPRVLRYRFEVKGQDIAPAPGQPVQLEVRKAEKEEAGKEVWLDLFEGPARRSFGPVAAREQNPILLVFLQLDTNEMGSLTGGASGYFQQQIRRAFNHPAPVEPVTIELDGVAIAGVRIVIRPFRDDPRIDRFPAFREKAYEITVSDGVPGGLWQFVTRTSDPRTGAIVLEKSLTFEAAEP